jgi:hypothetical protein
MLGHLRTRTLPSLIAALLVAVAVGDGWAVAASGGSKIHACSAKKTGALRIAKKCKRSERTVTWNTQGRRGARGRTGPRGHTGPTAAFLTTDGGPPPDSASITVFSSGVTMPTAGKLFITATTTAEIACTAEPCGEYYELFVDGHPLPAGGVQTLTAPDSSTTPFVMAVTGVSGSLAPGAHTIVLARDSNVGSPTITQLVGYESTISSVLIGG